MYTVEFDDIAVGFLEKLDRVTRKRIFEKIISTKANPFRYFNRLTGREDYKLRVGNYRIIAEILRDEKRIKVTLIGHRKKIYKRQSFLREE